MISLGVLLVLIVGTVPIEGGSYDITIPTEWWQTTVLYQIWPRSFKDSDGDGIGDLNGITSKLPELLELGIKAIWLSPIFTSPLADSGYDIADYRNINPTYGTLEDLKNLIAVATELGIKVLLDFVPNHTSDEHEWFIKSKAGIEPYTDYYVWDEGIIDENDTRQPPNNWLSLFNTGSAWEWVEERQAYYLHQFHVKQADLNFSNPLVIQETKDIMTYWFDLGISGFRVDALPFMVEGPFDTDEPSADDDRYVLPQYYYLNHIQTRDLIGNYEIVQMWRDHIDEYVAAKGDGIERVMFGEAYANISMIMQYYDYGIHAPFNFFFVNVGLENNPNSLKEALDVVDVINQWMENMPDGSTANWVMGNHDMARIATKLGEKRVDSINFMLLLLPGIATIFNGDEMGMPNTDLTWEQTTDARACSTNEDVYEQYSRDPMRTPYQWDNTTSAGFSTNSTTELPVNENYLTLNLAAQKEADVSHWKNVQAAIKLRDTDVIREGSLNVEVIDDLVVAFTRELDGEQPIAVLMNWDLTNDITISAEVFENLPTNLKVLIADVHSGITVGDVVEKTSIELPAGAAVVLQGISKKCNRK